MDSKTRRAYRIAFEFHAQHQPAENNAAFWERTARDMVETASSSQNDSFLLDLLAAVYDQLEREAQTQ